MAVSYILVAVGGAIGAMLRHAVHGAAHEQLGVGFPYGTLLVNVLGGLLMGIVAGLFLARGGWDENWRLFLTTGVLGGFTTFSAFSLEAWAMWERTEYVPLAIYVAASVLLSIAALGLGLASVRGAT